MVFFSACRWSRPTWSTSNGPNCSKQEVTANQKAPAVDEREWLLWELHCASVFGFKLICLVESVLHSKRFGLFCVLMVFLKGSAWSISSDVWSCGGGGLFLQCSEFMRHMDQRLLPLLHTSQHRVYSHWSLYSNIRHTFLQMDSFVHNVNVISMHEFLVIWLSVCACGYNIWLPEAE